jgi:hypothetical protein
MRVLSLTIPTFGILRGAIAFPQVAGGDKDKIQGNWKVVSLGALEKDLPADARATSVSRQR